MSPCRIMHENRTEASWAEPGHILRNLITKIYQKFIKIGPRLIAEKLFVCEEIKKNKIIYCVPHA